MYELVFLTGPRAGDKVPVMGALLAGRSPDCTLEVPDPNASRNHARVTWDGSHLSFTDNRSANGSFINDQRVGTMPIRLANGDVIRMGETRLRVAKVQKPGNHSESSLSSSSAVVRLSEHEADLSQSIALNVDDWHRRQATPEALSQRLAAVVRASKLLAEIANAEKVLSGILDVLFDLFPQAERGYLLLGNTVESLVAKAVRYRSGLASETESEGGLAISTSICNAALQQRSALLYNDDHAGGQVAAGMSIVSLKIRSAMTIPLIIDEKILGLLTIDTAERRRSFTSSDLDLALAVAQQAAIALHNANLLHKVEQETANRNNLLRFLPGPVAQQVLDGQLDLGLGGRTYNGTILFSDMIGFTRMSETMQPQAVVQMMNDYFTAMVPLITGEHGSIDKFIGDAIMAFWGIPIENATAPHSAALAGLAMQVGLISFNAANKAKQREAIQHAIGINTGPVVAGNIGAAGSQLSYTLLGDAVNTAARIEHAASAGQVLVSQATWSAIPGAYGLRLPPITVRNKRDPLVVYSLRGMNVEGGEVMLHLPVRCGEHLFWLIRRLSDQTFIALHPRDCDPCAGSLMSAAQEWPDVDLGRAEMMQTLTAGTIQETGLVRSQLRLPDPSLCKLIGDPPLTCTLPWEKMVRS